MSWVPGTQSGAWRIGKRHVRGGQVVVQVEALVREWNYYAPPAVSPRCRHPVKALNIELFESGNFTVSLLALSSTGGNASPPSHGFPNSRIPAWKDRRLARQIFSASC